MPTAGITCSNPLNFTNLPSWTFSARLRSDRGPWSKNWTPPCHLLQASLTGAPGLTPLWFSGFKFLRPKVTPSGSGLVLLGTADGELSRFTPLAMGDPTESRSELMAFGVCRNIRPVVEHGTEPPFRNSTGDIWITTNQMVQRSLDAYALPPRETFRG